MPTRLSILSDILFFPVVLFTAFLHVVTKPLGIESTVSMLIAGGLFGLALIPLGLSSLTMAVLEGVIPGSAYTFLRFVGLPFSVLYFVQTLILDTAHLKVKNADPHVPRNVLEQLSANFFNACVDYCPISCIPWSDNATLSPSQQYVFAVHPHGIHCLPLTQFTVRGGDFDKKFPGLVGKCVSGLAATVIFKLPLVRELFLLMGYVDASRAVASKVLKEGRSLFVCTGGEEESMLTVAGEDVVVLKKRKGFVRLALSHGAHLVPVFGVGNSDLYTVSRILERLLILSLKQSSTNFRSDFQLHVQTATMAAEDLWYCAAHFPWPALQPPSISKTCQSYHRKTNPNASTKSLWRTPRRQVS